MSVPLPSFTLIIPTRERAETLRYSLASVCAQNYDALEIIVSDNASTDDTRQVVEAANDPRIRYLNTGARVSMTANWEFALRHATGDWVGIIGDDDALLRDSLKVTAELSVEFGVDAVRSTSCSYSWPELLGRPNGELTVPLSAKSRLRDSAAVLTDVRHGAVPYTALPMLYNGGFVARKVIDAIRGANGDVYRSRIPDVYSSIMIAAVLPHYVEAGRPLAINGASRHSTGTSYFRPTARETDSPAARFHAEPNLPYHPATAPAADGSLPASIELLILESLLHVRDAGRAVEVGDPADWLSLIICRSNADPLTLSEWVGRFAALHGLAQPDCAQIRATGDDRAAQLLRRLRLLPVNWNFVRIGPDGDTPVRNVAEAAAAADHILSARPAAAPLIVRNLTRRVLRGAL